MSFSITEVAPIIGYPLKTTQTEFISTAGVPGTPETATTGNIILSGSTATTEQFTAPSSTKPDVIATVVRASRVSSDKVAVVSFADTPSAIAARYWRLLITDNNGNPSYVTTVDIELRATVGGADQTDPTGTGMEYTALSEANVGNRAGLSFDNDYTNTKWASAARPTVGSPQWIKANFDTISPFDTKVFVGELSIIGCIAGQTDMAPKDFTLQRSDDDSTWTTVLTVTGQTGWTAGERRNFAV